MSSVMCVGIATLDHIFQVESFTEQEHKTRATMYESVGGGMAANAAVAIVRAGGRAILSTNLGDDLTGSVILEELRTDYVDISQVNIVNGVASPVASVLINNKGERQIVSHIPRTLFERNWPLPNLPSDCSAVMVDTRWPSGACAALSAARKQDIPGVVDLEIVDNEDVGPILLQASHIVVPRESLEILTGVDNPAVALRKLTEITNAHVSVTLGSEGVIWLEGNTLQKLPAVQIDALDTVGAGDVFHGILAKELGEGRDFRGAATEANLVAALKCTKKGGRRSVPNLTQINAFKVRLGLIG